MRRDGPWRRAAEALSSLKLTLACLLLLMALVVICTLAQVPLGTHTAVERTIRSFLVWWTPPGTSARIPVFPGGGLVGGLLLVNLLFAQFLRLERSRRKAGLWLAHLGLALLFAGEFAAAFFQIESQMPIEIGQTRDYSEDYRAAELAVMDATDPGSDLVTAIPRSFLEEGGAVEHPSLPFALRVERYYENSVAGPDLGVSPAPPVTTDDALNAPAALVEPVAEGRPLGSFWVSWNGPARGFSLGGRDWRLRLRPRRYYLPFSLTLKEFRHDVYPGTNIPKNFSSLVRLKDEARGEDRDALIYMNNPLRYGGKTFYQASFGKGDTLSVLQVVRNPGWLIPYLSCVLAALGMALHFGQKLAASQAAGR